MIKPIVRNHNGRTGNLQGITLPLRFVSDAVRTSPASSVGPSQSGKGTQRTQYILQASVAH